MVHPLSRQRRRLASSLVAGALIALVVCSGAASADPPAGGIGEITVLSNRADLISGGDALVSVDLRANARAVKVELNGANITSAFSLRAERPLRRARHEPRRGRESPARSAGERRRTVDRDPQPPDRRAGVLGASGPAMALPHAPPDEPVARTGDRREVQRADDCRALLPERRGPIRPLRPGESAGPCRRPADDDGSRQDRSVHRRARDRHGQPRHLSVRAPGRPDEAGVAVDGAALEPQVRQYLRWGVRRQLPAADGGQRAQRPERVADRAWVRRRNLGPEHLRQPVQRHRLRRGADDDEGDPDRAPRPDPLCDRYRSLGGNHAAAPHHRGISRPARRHHHEPPVRGSLVPGGRLVRLHPALALLRAPERVARPAEQPEPAISDASGTSEGVGLESGGTRRHVRDEDQLHGGRAHRGLAVRLLRPT